MVLSIESVVEEILMKQFHTLSSMYGKFFCKVVSLSMGKIRYLSFLMDNFGLNCLMIGFGGFEYNARNKLFSTDAK